MLTAKCNQFILGSSTKEGVSAEQPVLLFVELSRDRWLSSRDYSGRLVAVGLLAGVTWQRIALVWFPCADWRVGCDWKELVALSGWLHENGEAKDLSQVIRRSMGEGFGWRSLAFSRGVPS